MKGQETVKQIVQQDGPPIAIGGGFIGMSQLLHDAASIASDIGLILGAVLVAVTLWQRLKKGGGE